MGRSVLVALATRRGPAFHVGTVVAEVFAAHGLLVDLLSIPQVRELDRYGAIVLGGPTHLGRWHRDARDFLRRHRRAVDTIPIALFASHHEGRGDDGAIDRALADTPEIEPVLRGYFRVTSRVHGEFDRDEVERWAEELARELGA